MLKVVIAAVALCRAAQLASGSAVLKASKDVLLKAVHDYCGYEPPQQEVQPAPLPNSYISWALLKESAQGNSFVIPMLTVDEKRLADSGQKIEAIKKMRGRGTNSLAEAKFAVEFYQVARYTNSSY